MHVDTLTIVGVGLIGGSIGLAAKARGLARRVRGSGRHRATLERAHDLGALDEVCPDLREAAAGADLVIFCTPVDAIADQAIDAAAGCKPGAILTDAGSTKAKIVRAIDGRLPPGVAFVGGHPLAGSERRGPENGDPNLFQGRWVVLTPTEATDPAALERVRGFWQGLGARVRLMDPESHDAALALTSHLPHLVAAALAGVLPPEAADLTATGFRDSTRIAAGDPGLWTAIFSHNRPALLAALDQFEERLRQFRRALEARDEPAVDSLLAHGKKVRDALGS
jgi:prephenate dehydrogenase